MALHQLFKVRFFRFHYCSVGDQLSAGAADAQTTNLHTYIFYMNGDSPIPMSII